MGLGVGIDCECCGRQLCYGTDDAEIVQQTALDEEGRQEITGRPILCHDCARVAEWLAKRAC